MKRISRRLAFTVFAAILYVPASAFAQISLGSTQSYGVLAGSTVTNTGASVVTGNVGVSTGTAITGFPPGVIVGGAQHSNDVGPSGAQQAQTDLTTAYNAVAGTACTVDLTGQDMGGLTLTPGVYCFTSSAQLTGTLTLNMQGNPAAVFLFKIGSTLTTASGSSVVLINNGVSTCPPNVYWQVGSSATLGTTTSFTGNILALTSITLTTNAHLNGRALARTGAVTLDTNTVTACAPAIVCPVITVLPATLPSGAIGTAYNQTVSGSGGTAPYTFAVTSGTLPTGLLLNASTGAITGSPLTAATFNFTITASDANGCPGSRAFTIVIAAAGCSVITLSPNTLPPGVIGNPYSQTITASGGTAPYTFSVISGALPNGLTLGGNGSISGIPLTAGLFNFTVRATDNAACPGSLAYSILISAPAVVAAGGPTLDFAGLTILVLMLAVAGVIVMNKFFA